MSDAESVPLPERTLSHRGWIPAVTVGAALVVNAILAVLPADRLDSGLRPAVAIISCLLAALVLLAWFFFFARYPLRARMTGVLMLLAAIVAMALSVRRVEFSGDMVPTFDYRWSLDRADVLESHRAKSHAAAGKEKVDSPVVQIEIRPEDMLEYRGPRRDGIVEGPRLARDWSANPPKVVWRQPVGGGYASFVVAGPLAITIEQRRDREAVVAYDVETGRERWIYDYPALFAEIRGGDGPRATSTIDHGKVYSLGATGVLSCVELSSGRGLWSLNILQQNGSGNIEWGMSGSPLVYDDLVLVNPGNQEGSAASKAITTFDAATGKPQWGSGAARAGYASPMLATLGGTRQILIFDAAGLGGYDATDGRELWRVPWKSAFDINAAQPVVLDDEQVLITSDAGAALIKLVRSEGQWSTVEVWRKRTMRCYYACPIAFQGHLYGLDQNILACIELGTGKLAWKDRAGQYGHGQMLLSNELLVVLAETGELALVEANPERFHELGRIQAIEGKTWNNPTLVGNRLFVRNHLEMAAYDLPTEP